MKYYLQIYIEWDYGNTPYWWAKEGAYTIEIDQARLFIKEEAEEILRLAGPYKYVMWEESKVHAATVKTVDLKKLKWGS